MIGREQRQVGFDWYPGNPLSGDAQNGAPASAPRPVQPPQAVGTLSGILTDPQFRTVVRALEQRKDATMLGAPTGLTISGNPLVVQRPDGWKFQICPIYNAASGKFTMTVGLWQNEGEYAGFHLSSTVRVAPGEAVLFSDTYSSPAKKKETAASQKRLILMITPTMAQ